MAEFINSKVGVEEDNNEEENEVSDDSDLDSPSPFIDNAEKENDSNFYRNFDNVETDIEQTLKVEYDKGLEHIENFYEISNLCESLEDEAEIDEFQTSAGKIKCFGESLLPKTKSNEETEHNSFIRIISYAIRYDKENKTNVCDKNEFKKTIDDKFIEQLYEEKYKFILDLQKFNNNCHEINCFLSKYNHFLRVFELKNQFRHLTRKDPKKQNIVRQISSCLIENCNGFQSISIEFARREIKKFKPTDIIYKLTKNPEISPLC